MDGYVQLISAFLEIPTLLQLNGTAVPCVATELLDSLPEGNEWAEQEKVAKNCAASAYAGKCVFFFASISDIPCNYVGRRS